MSSAALACRSAFGARDPICVGTDPAARLSFNVLALFRQPRREIHQRWIEFFARSAAADAAGYYAPCLQSWPTETLADVLGTKTSNVRHIWNCESRERTLAGFADTGDHNSVFEPSRLELHYISGPQPFEHATVRDVKGHFHRLHPDASVRALHRLNVDGDRGRTRAGVDSSNLTPRMNVPSWRNELIMFPIELFKPLAWR